MDLFMSYNVFSAIFGNPDHHCVTNGRQTEHGRNV